MNSDLAISEIVGQFAETELRKFFRASEIGSGQVLISDCNGTIEYVNPAFCRVTGYSEEKLDSLDFSGEQMQFMTKPFSPADLAKLVHKCLSEDTTTHGEQKE